MSKAKMRSKLRHYNQMAMKHYKNAKKNRKFLTKGDLIFSEMHKKAKKS